MADKPLPRSFYQRDALTVAAELLGKTLTCLRRRTVVAGRIVEVEAYLGEEDPASHAYRGVTPRNAVMFGEGGFAYVYFTYGNHYCVNVVTGRAGMASAVLIRALEPMRGLEVMKKRRGKKDLKDLTSGPGKLTQALGIDLRINGADLTKGPIWISEDPKAQPYNLIQTPRIGISVATKEQFRFLCEGSPFVSRYRPARP